MPSPRRSTPHSLRCLASSLLRMSEAAAIVQAMAKSAAGAAGYRCTECGWQSLKWSGRCGECQAWGTVEEAGAPRLARTSRLVAHRSVSHHSVSHHSGAPVSTPAVPIGQVDTADASARPTGLDELDRVLGGGLVPGAVVLLAGEPGVGKSTL